jgi:hypothetical protein
MRFLLIAALAAPLLSVAPPVQPAQTPPSVAVDRASPEAPRAPEGCARTGITYAKDGVTGRPRTLNDQPPANLYLAVDRQIAGCPTPATLRTGIVGR